MTLTLFLLSQVLFFFYKRFVNFLHFEMLPLFRINLLHLKVVFHQVRVNLFCVNLQYLNFMER